MKTSEMNRVISSWAHSTNQRIRLFETRAIHSREDLPQTNVELKISDEITGQVFVLEIWIPHGRRTPFYFYGPQAEDSTREGDDFFFPSFEDEASLIKSLDIVYKRFMTDYGMMRFPIDRDPASIRKELLDLVTEWIFLRVKRDFCARELTPAGDNLRHGGIEMRPTGRDSSGTVFRISSDNSLPQIYLHGKFGAPHHAVLPAFYTDEEFYGALEYAAMQINTAKRRAGAKRK